MKFSELGNVVVAFLNESEEIVHEVVFDSYPNVASMKNICEEIQYDLEFGYGEVALNFRVDILDMDSYISKVGDREVEE